MIWPSGTDNLQIICRRKVDKLKSHIYYTSMKRVNLGNIISPHVTLMMSLELMMFSIMQRYHCYHTERQQGDHRHHLGTCEVAQPHPIGSGECEGIPEEQLGGCQGTVAQTESKIHQELMMDRIGWGLQLPPPNLILPNGVDRIRSCVIIIKNH